MELEILEKKTNPLLDRTDITFKVIHEKGTPSRTDVKKKLAAVLGVSAECVFIETLKTGFGAASTKGYARIYKDRSRAEQVEQAYIITRNILGEKEETPKEPEEEPKEEKTEKE